MLRFMGCLLRLSMSAGYGRPATGSVMEITPVPRLDQRPLDRPASSAFEAVDLLVGCTGSKDPSRVAFGSARRSSAKALHAGASTRPTLTSSDGSRWKAGGRR